MADVIDIIHNLSYTADMSVIEAISKLFGAQFDALVELNKQLGVYQQALDKLGKDNVKDIQTVNAQIDAQKSKINEVTANIGKQFVENEKLTKSFAVTKDKLSGLSTAGLEFAKASLHFGEGMKEGIIAIAEKIPDLVGKFREAKSSGSSVGEILTTLGSSLFSMNGLIELGVQALVVFGEKLFDSGENAEKAAEEVEKYKTAVKESTQALIDNAKAEADHVQNLKNLHGEGINAARRHLELLQAQGAGAAQIYDAQAKQNDERRKSLQDEKDTLTDITERATQLGEYYKGDDDRNPGRFKKALLEKLEQVYPNVAEDDLDKQADAIVKSYGKSNNVLIGLKKRINELKEQLKDIDNEDLINETRYDAASKQKANPTAGNNSLTNAPGQNKREQRSHHNELKEAEDNDKELQDLYKYEQDITEKYTAVLNEDAKQNISRTLDEKIARERDYKEKIERIKLAQKIRVNEHREEMSNTSTELNKLKIEHANLEKEFAEQKDVVEPIDNFKNPDVNPTLPKRTNVDPIAKEKAEEEKRKKQKIAITKDVEEITDMVNQSIQTLGAAISKIYEQQDKALQKQEAAQQTRVDFLVAHADRGNAELLRQEQERLNAIQEKREQVAKKQLALNKILTVSEQAKSMAEAIGAVVEAAVGGDPYTIAARIIAAVGALVAGVATIKSTFSGDAFAEGVVGYNGRGTATSDSNVVRISRGESVITADATQRYAPMLRAMNLGLPLHIPVAQLHANGDYASKKELHTLNHKMDQLIAATEGNSVRVNQHIDRHGVHQLVETARHMERVRWR